MMFPPVSRLPRDFFARFVLVAFLLGGSTGPGFVDSARAAKISTGEKTVVSGEVATTTLTFFSPALGRETTCLVVHPRRFAPGRAYPVLYLLHGAFGSYEDWTAKTNLVEIHGGRPLVIVTPDGGPFGWYVDSATVPEDRYETFATRDLIAEIEKRFPVAEGRDGRGIAGLSMGGHGALSLAARHPELFSSASSLSGILNLVHHADPVPHAERFQMNAALGRYADAPERWHAHSVAHLADRFVEGDVALLFDTGDEDQVGAVEDGRHAHERLTNRGVAHVYREHPGKHDWAYWGARIPEHVAFHLANFEGRARGEPPATGQRVEDPKWHRRYLDRTLAFERENAERRERPDAPRPVVLLGSSSIEHMQLYNVFDDWHVVNRGISADGLGVRPRGILRRLHCSVFDCDPRAVVLLNGRNDLAGTARDGQPAFEDVVATYRETVRRIRAGAPEADLFVCACPPTSRRYEFMAPVVRQFRDAVERIAREEGDKVHFVDSWTPFADENGFLKEGYNSDGLHLNREGHAVLRAILVAAFDAANVTPAPAPPAAPEP